MKKAVPILLACLLLSLAQTSLPAAWGEQESPSPAIKPKVDLVPRVMLRRFPDVIQSNSSSCGVAAYQAVTMYLGIWGYQDIYSAKLGTTKEEGTHPAKILENLRKEGLDARIEEGMTVEGLKSHIDAGHIVIIDFQAWGKNPDYSREWEDGHYAIAVGYNDDILFIEDPSLLGTTGYLKWDDFESRWHDYENEAGGKRREYVRMGIVVVPAARGPRLPLFTPID